MTRIHVGKTRCEALLVGALLAGCAGSEKPPASVGQASQRWSSRDEAPAPENVASAATQSSDGSGHREGRHDGHGTPPPTATPVLLPPDTTGRVASDTNSLGIEGHWRVFGDFLGADGKPPGICQTGGYAEADCSRVTGPGFTLPGFPKVAGSVCTTGSTARVLLVDGAPDYGHLWGTGVGLRLAALSAAGALEGFDASRHGVVGISFDIDHVPGELRVVFPTPTDPVPLGPDYWGAAEFYPPSPVVAGTNVVLFSEVQSPEPTPRALDTTQLLEIGFQIPSNPQARQSFSFCISNLQLLVDKPSSATESNGAPAGPAQD
jgi:hypothetical protein